MKRILTAALTALLLAIALGACDDGSQDDPGYGYASSGVDCSQYASCGTCTPVLGCGWCYNGNGAGTCASDPDRCTGSQFSWTWEPTGCRVAADASAVGVDAGAESGADAALDGDAAPASDAAPSSDAAGD
jgi:hypothetical protein